MSVDPLKVPATVVTATRKLAQRRSAAYPEGLPSLGGRAADRRVERLVSGELEKVGTMPIDREVAARPANESPLRFRADPCAQEEPIPTVRPRTRRSHLLVPAERPGPLGFSALALLAFLPVLRRRSDLRAMPPQLGGLKIEIEEHHRVASGDDHLVAGLLPELTDDEPIVERPLPVAECRRGIPWSSARAVGRPLHGARPTAPRRRTG